MSEWIKCSDRLPLDDYKWLPVWFCYGTGVVLEGFYCSNRFADKTQTGEYPATHWMPRQRKPIAPDYSEVSPNPLPKFEVGTCWLNECGNRAEIVGQFGEYFLVVHQMCRMWDNMLNLKKTINDKNGKCCGDGCTYNLTKPAPPEGAQQ
jgi:hypothetical protein